MAARKCSSKACSICSAPACSSARSTERVLHAGFFVGSRAFYRALREMPPDIAGKIQDDVDLLRQRALSRRRAKRRARVGARFINDAMMATLLGDVVSDGLDDGRIVSGVGGQYNFVAQAFALEGARSAIMLRAAGRRKAGPNRISAGATGTRRSRATCATSSSPNTALPTSAAKATATSSRRCWRSPIRAFRTNCCVRPRTPARSSGRSSCRRLRATTRRR